MRLKTRPSYWQTISHEAHSYAALEGEVSTGVLIVGAGISGALIAWFLVDAGIDVIMIDRQQPGQGSSSASTGLLQYEIDTPLFELIGRVGEKNAVQAYQLGISAIDTLQNLCQRLPGQASFSRRDSLYFASSADDLEMLRLEYECRKKYGFDVEYLDRETLLKFSTIDAGGAIYSYRDAQMNPLRFTRALLDQCVARGLRIFGDSAVEKIEQGLTSVVASTAHGKVSAQRIIYATGYDSSPFLDYKRGALHSTYVACSKPVDDFRGWPAGALIWETARPYFYARQTGDGRILIGGEDTPYADDHRTQDLIDQKADLLCERFRDLFPAIDFELDMCWAGTFGESADGLAWIGQVDANTHEYFCLGYGGNGITFSVIAGELLRDQILVRPSRNTPIFSFQR